jgi:hypothetical protein
LVVNTFLTTPSVRVRRKSDQFLAIRARSAGRIELAYNKSVIAAASVFAGYTAVMLVAERGMRRIGGPGIVAFELAGTEQRANQIMASWGDRGRRAARASPSLDFGYAASHGALTALLLDRIRQRHNDSRLIVVVAGAAALADAIEGLSRFRSEPADTLTEPPR